MVGFTGGLLPCPSALAVFSLSGTTADPKSAFCMMLLYIAGFIAVMSGLILGASFIKNKAVSNYFNDKKKLSDTESKGLRHLANRFDVLGA